MVNGSCKRFSFRLFHSPFNWSPFDSKEGLVEWGMKISPKNRCLFLIPKLTSDDWLKIRWNNKTWTLQRPQSPNENHDDIEKANPHEKPGIIDFLIYGRRDLQLGRSRSLGPCLDLLQNVRDNCSHEYQNYMGQPPACPFYHWHAY